ncbi:B12-binding domain-containing radical SAM protein [Trinickia fusca]|uniref:Radical SAM protein n=1 Tax=Trinickia fusca TaxID=2419777 RepID=A0A494X9W0_9BURK|nr:cobalamin-dependent protein [Trinickia fusca]RKP45216.1 radical SAM protein [Trinickia fusca]
MGKSRNVVFFINPPNSNDIGAAPTIGDSVSKGVQHTDWANFPHLGILSLASYVDSLPELDAIYIDGVVHPIDVITSEIQSKAATTLAVCLSAITANYEASLRIAHSVKTIDPAISIIMGNDHFSALSREILSRHRTLIDCGFVGNEIYTGLGEYLQDLRRHTTSEIYPGSVRWVADRLIVDPQIREEVNRVIDYRLIDRVLPHTSTYSRNFTRRLGHRICDLTGRHAKCGVPVEISRGCIKFSGDDACSFCSIQYGGMWKNELPAVHAWQAIRAAWSAGYDYLYVTADELPLTFSRLMLDMANTPPIWWQELEPDERPILVGYARADGMEKEHVLKAMRQIGFQILFVGVDAGASLSLRALNKPLKNKDPQLSSQRMSASNLRALENARRHRVSIKAGFVLGHLGMNDALLGENVRTYVEFLRSGQDVIVSADIELLSPEPGSKDFYYLTHPDAAAAISSDLDLEIAPIELREHIAADYRGIDIFDRERAIEDYIRAFMPRLSKNTLTQARDYVRASCLTLGIVIGDEI